MKRRAATLLLAVLPAFATAATPSTAQRLELLERRVSRITDLTLQLDQVRSENRELRGEIENLGYEIERLKRKQRDIYLDIDQRLGTLSGAGAAPAVPPPAATGGGAPVEEPAALATRTPESAAPGPAPAAATVDRAAIEAEYQAAYALLSPQQKRYADAAKAFEAFLAKHPNDALAPNAQYWLGEAHYVSQRNAAAQQAFEVVINRYPDDPKAPGALFKIGRLQQAAGNAAAARASYERVLSDYPDSPAAGLARQRLDTLGR